MDIGEVMDVWDDVETDGDMSSGAEDFDIESECSNDDISDQPSTSTASKSRPSRSAQSTLDLSWREVTESKQIR